MKLSIREKKVLYAFACPNHHNTVTRLKWLTALTVDPQAKHRMLELARKMETEMEESWYTGFYHQLRAEMDEYWQLHNINEIMNTVVTGWKPFSNPRMFAGYGRQRGWERGISGNELPDNEDGFVELSEEEVRQLELPKEWIA